VKAHAPDLPCVMPFKRACQETGFHYTTMRDAHFRGDLAVIKVGRSWYVSLDELARFIDAQTERQPTPITVLPAGRRRA